MINLKMKSVARNAIAAIVSAITALAFVGAIGAPALAFAASGHSEQQAFAKFPRVHNAVEYVDANAVGSTQNGSLSNPFLTISAALTTLNASTSQATSTIDVAAGTYTEDLTIPQKNLTIQGAGAGLTNISSDGTNTAGITVTGQNSFTLNDVTWSASALDSKVLYALNAYQSYNLTLNNDVFVGQATNAGGALMDGVQINNSNSVLLNGVTSENFGQDGFSVIAKFNANNPTHTTNITFNGITAQNNSTDGIGFYTTATDQGGTGQHRIAGAIFSGTNTLVGNGNGIFIEGDTNANYLNGTTPRFIVVSNPPQQGPIINPTLDVNNVNFSGNLNQDIINYQTAAVSATSSQFNGLTGAQMTPSQQTHEETKIYDQRALPALGLVTFF